MRLLLPHLIIVSLSLAGAALAQTTNTQTQATVNGTSAISGFTYQTTNPVTYFKTATGLLVVLSPAALTGSGPLRGHTEGLTIEIPNFFINQLFF